MSHIINQKRQGDTNTNIRRAALRDMSANVADSLFSKNENYDNLVPISVQY